MKYRPGHANNDRDFLPRMPMNVDHLIKEHTKETTKEDIQSTINGITATKKCGIG